MLNESQTLLFFFQAEDGIRDLTVTGVQTCALPIYAADGYVARLVKKGFRVAICEQTEDPKKAKGLVRRERSEERRVGKVCTFRCVPSHEEINSAIMAVAAMIYLE